MTAKPRSAWARTTQRLCAPVLFVAGAAITPATEAADRSSVPANSPPHIDVDVGALDRDLVMIGGGMGLVPSFEGSGEYVLVPIGGFRGRAIGLTVAGRGTQILVDIIHHDDRPGAALHIGPVVNVNINRASRYGDPRIRALGIRDIAVEAGAYVGITFLNVANDRDALALGAAYLADTSGVHDSYLLVPSVDYGMRIGRHSYLGLSASAAFAGSGYARTYFAVDRYGSRASGLPEFANPRGGLKTVSLSAVVNHSFGRALGNGFGVYGLVSYSRLQGDFAKSPLVSIAGSADQWFGAMGLGYTF